MKTISNRLTLSMIGLGTLCASCFAMSDTYACGPTTDCRLGERTYRIRMPENHENYSKIGAIFFMHGYRGSAKGVMGNRSLGNAVSDLGLALVAPKIGGG